MNMEEYKQKHEEEWRPVVYDKFNGEYQISNYGNLKNKKSQLIKFDTLHTGYYSIHLYSNRYKRRFGIHKLVALAFLEKPENWNEDWEVDHLDGDKTNNNPSNLEWVSSKENIRRAIMNGFRKTKYDPEVAFQICEYLSNEALPTDTLDSISKKFNVEKDLVEGIYNRRRWKVLLENYPNFRKLASNQARDPEVIEEICKLIADNKTMSNAKIAKRFNDEHPELLKPIGHTLISYLKNKKVYIEISDKYFKEVISNPRNRKRDNANV